MNIEEMTIEQIDEELSLLKKEENGQHAKGRYTFDGGKVNRQKQLTMRKLKLKMAAKKA